MRAAAKSLLMHLRFVTSNAYSGWLLETLRTLATDEKCAVYSVRNFHNQKCCLWDESGDVLPRSGEGQGSEDLVYGWIVNASRLYEGDILQHPSLEVLKEGRVRNIVLVDDSIGSGDRMAEFIRSMMLHKTFRSWWSLNLIKFYIVSLARTNESEGAILAALPGAEHRNRKHAKSSKVEFVSEVVYSRYRLERRWGEGYVAILGLCDTQTAVPKDGRRGYGDVMANIIFYHSVPNNTPGILWFRHKRWKPLFARRAIPGWFCSLLDTQVVSRKTRSQMTRGMAELPSDILETLILIKQGIRRMSSLAVRLDLDPSYVGAVLRYMIMAGLVSENRRITEAGIAALKRRSSTSSTHTLDYSLYIPGSWNMSGL